MGASAHTGFPGPGGGAERALGGSTQSLKDSPEDASVQEAEWPLAGRRPQAGTAAGTAQVQSTVSDQLQERNQGLERKNQLSVTYTNWPEDRLFHRFMQPLNF